MAHGELTVDVLLCREEGGLQAEVVNSPYRTTPPRPPVGAEISKDGDEVIAETATTTQGGAR